MSTVYLSRVSYTVGDRVRIEDTGDPGLLAELDTLADEGIHHVRVAGTPLPVMAATAATTTLAGAPAPPDAVVYCQDTPTGATPAEVASDLARRLGSPETPVVGVGGNGCGNLGPGLRVATALVAAEQLGGVLLVTADKAPGSRYLPSDLTALSDGAAACLLTPSLSGPGYRVHGTATSTRADLDPATAGMAGTKTVMAGIRAATRKVLGAAGATHADCRHVLVGNYGEAMRMMLTRAAGFERTACHTPLAAEHGHCFAADPLIGLTTLTTLADGDLLVLLSTSPRSWSATLVEYVGDGAG